MGMAPYKVTTKKIDTVVGTIEMIDEMDPFSAAKVWGDKHFDLKKVSVSINEVSDEGMGNMTVIKSTGLFNKPKFFNIQVTAK